MDLQLIYYLLSIFCSFTSSLEDSATGCSKDNKIKKANAIWFFAQNHINEKISNDNGMGYLGISLKANVKPCVAKSEQSGPQTYHRSILRRSKDTCDCKKSLEASLENLVEWAQNEMGMSTATITLNIQENFNISERSKDYYKYEPSTKNRKAEINNKDTNIIAKTEIGIPNKSWSKRKEQDDDSYLREYLELENNLNKNDLPDLKIEKDSSIAMINAFPQKNKIDFNNINPYLQHRPLERFINVRRDKRELIIEPEHRQIFSIDFPNAKEEELKEISEIPALQPDSSNSDRMWDILGVMSAIRQSFFSNFFNPFIDTRKRKAEEESGTNLNGIGSVKQLSLFELVRTTLEKIQGEAEKSSHGYLLIVTGGSLKDICDAYSDTMQAVKHVLEVTTSEDTVLVFTGNCPEEGESADGEMGNDVQLYDARKKKEDSCGIPVYVTGPHIENFTQVEELCDIPLKIREVILAISGTSNTNEYFSSKTNQQPRFANIRKFAKERYNFIDNDGRYKVIRYDDDDEVGDDQHYLKNKRSIEIPSNSHSTQVTGHLWTFVLLIYLVFRFY